MPIMKVIIKKKKKKPVQECDGGVTVGGCDLGPAVGPGMGDVVIGGPDRFDMGFVSAPFTQAGVPNKKKKRIKLKKRRK